MSALTETGIEVTDPAPLFHPAHGPVVGAAAISGSDPSRIFEGRDVLRGGRLDITASKVHSRTGVVVPALYERLRLATRDLSGA